MQIRCPHCRHPVEVIDEKLLDDVTCPSCGSNISLVSNDTTVAHLPAGARRLGHFDLLNQIGMGGFGAVWKARDTVLDRIVALKVPRRGQLEATEVEYFFRDARAAAQLRHPSIVSVHEVGRDGETVFIASDFIEGANLHEWLSARPLTVRESAELVAEIAEAVQHAHERGVVHRDLKPGNILIDLEGHPHITDFGLAKRDSGEITMTVDGQILGTPAYMSPEQARGKAHEADAASDVYSLGVVLFELLTGELPFRGEKRMLMLQILNDEPPSPRKLNSRVPRDLETVCLKAMAKEPARRYSAASDLGADLRRYLAGKPILARPVGSVERAWRWCKRNSAIAALLFAVVCSLSLGVIASGYFAWSESTQRKDALTLAAEKIALAIEKSQLAENNQKLAGDARNAAFAATSERDLSRRLQYAADVSLSFQLWQSPDGTARQIRELLRALEPKDGQADLREFAWRYQWSLLDRGSKMRRFAERPFALGISGAGELISMGQNAKVQFWKWLDEEPTGDRLLSPKSVPVVVSLSRNGRDAALIDAEGNLSIVFTESGAVRHELGKLTGAKGLSFCSDGQYLAAISDDSVARVWSIETGEQQPEFNLDSADFRAYDLANDARSLLLTRGATLLLFKRAAATPVKLHDDTGGFMAYEGKLSPNGRFAALGTAGGETILWDTSTQNRLGELPTPSAAFRLAFADDGEQIAVGEKSGRVSIWSVKNRELLRTLKGHEASIQKLAFSDDNRYLVSCDAAGIARIWDLLGEEVRRLQEPEEVDGLAYSEDGHWLASGGPSGVQLRDLQTELPADTLDRLAARSVAFSPDSRFLAAGGKSGDVRVWDVSTYGPAKVLSRPASTQVEIGIVRFSPDGKILAAGYGRPTGFANQQPGAVALWEPATGELVQLIEFDSDASALAFSRDGTKLAVATHGGQVGLWDTDSWKLIEEWRVAPAYASILFSADDTELYMGTSGGTIQIWNMPLRILRYSLNAHADCVAALALSPDGRTLASGSFDRSIKLWHVPTLRELRTARIHASWVYSLDFSPDGSTLASGGVERAIVLLETSPHWQDR